MHETKIEQSHGAMLDAKWWGPYWVIAIAHNWGTYPQPELDGAELTGWIDGSRLKKFFTCNKWVHGTSEISKPGTTHEEDPEEFKEFEVEEVAGWKYIEGWWMYLGKWKDWGKWSWVWVADMAGIKKLVDRWNTTHPVPPNHPSKQWCERRMEGEGKAHKGGKGGDPLH